MTRGGKRPGAGRPAEAGARRDVLVRVLCTADERERWDAAADDDGTSLSEWARDAMDAWAGIPGGEPERRVGPPVTSGRSSEGARQVLVRISADEYAACEAQAERAGMSLAAWLRGLGMSVARR